MKPHQKMSGTIISVFYSLQVGDARGHSAPGINKCFLLIPLFYTSIVSDRNKRMPLGDDCHAWKKKTTDVKDQYDFKEVLGT